MNREISYWKIFLTFFKIGGFTFGGGYAMLPLIENDLVDKNKWIQRDEFLDLFAISQSLPGVFAVNMSIFIGYKLRRYAGASLAALGTILPSFIIILLIAMFFTQIKNNEVLIKVFYGIRPAVVALIAVPVFTTWQKMKMGWKALWIPLSVVMLTWYWDVSPIYIIIASAVAGIIYGLWIKKQLERRGK